MSELADRHCIPCEGGTPALAGSALSERLALVPSWSLNEAEEDQEITKSFVFSNFLEAVAFVDQLTPVAESEGHHPDLFVTWGRVDVHLSTHAARGLTDNDFILAAKLDRLQAGS